MSRNAIEISDSEYKKLAAYLQTPFHLYDEETIRNKCRKFKNAFSWSPDFINFFAVKALPNPEILKIILEEGFGADCSSLAELTIAENVGVPGHEIYFTSNNTPLAEFQKAKDLGAFLNLDDISHIDFVHETIGLPHFLSFRYNPGSRRSGNKIIGEPSNCKFGLTHDQIFEAYRKSQALGVKKFGLHSMVISNCLDEKVLFQNAEMLFNLALEIWEKTGVRIQTVNLGGGIGIPYNPSDRIFEIETLSSDIKKCYDENIKESPLHPLRIVFECGRYITGPAGVLVTRIIHQKNTYKKFIGIDACMADLMRPALYNAYHHIFIVSDNNPTILKSLPRRRNLFDGNHNLGPEGTYDVVGSLCENNDKFAVNRYLGTDVNIGDILVICDTGAHSHSMGFNYNGKLRPGEYLRSIGGRIVEIRRPEIIQDLFKPLNKVKLDI